MERVEQTGRGETMIEAFRKLWALLTPRERKRGIFLMVMLIGVALIETVGVASIMPFLAVLGNPALVEENPALHWTFVTFGFSSTDSFLFVLGIGAFVIIVGASVFRALAQYAMFRFAHLRRHSIGMRLLAGYLRQPYEFFLNRHTSDLSKMILSEVDQVIAYALKPALQMVAYGATSLVLVLFLVAVDPVIALATAGVVAGVYVLIYRTLRPILTRIGRDRALANRQRFTTAGEAMGGIKEIKALGREEAYLQRFHGPSKRFSRHKATNQSLAEIPRYMIEAVGFGGIIMLALVLMTTRETLGAVLPMLGLYAFAGYRLLPAAQQIYRAVSSLRFATSAVADVHNDLQTRAGASAGGAPGSRAAQHSGVLSFGEGIVFEKVTFRYRGAERPALRAVELAIPARAAVGFVGATGSGKTTLVDLLLGLLTPSEGRIVVGGVPLEAEVLPAWRRKIGYVPQDIFLADASVAENIAFGVPPGDTDRAAVERAARAAQLHRFVQDALPDGYDTLVGERGVRLSGGQRQRIGIARALYHEPELLVFDEATSALDNATEAAVMEAVRRLSRERTIVLVAHRLSTVQDCDLIYLLEDGEVSGRGRFEELARCNASLRRMIQAAG